MIRSRRAGWPIIGLFLLLVVTANFADQKMVAGFYGSLRSAIELPRGVNDSSCHEKVDHSCFSALRRGDGAGFLRERFRR